MNKEKQSNICLVVLNVRSAYNVGSLFRTADAVGVSMLYLVGYTPSPLDVFGRVRKDVSKVSLGAEATVLWKQCKSVVSLIKQLRVDGYEIVALEQSPVSIEYTSFKPKGKKIALIVGSEVEGIPFSIIKKCDYAIDLPMVGKKESLNVSVASGIALYWISTILGTKQFFPLRPKGKLNRSEHQK